MSDKAFCEIRQFTEYLEKCLGRQVFRFDVKPLTKPGDNYRSILQSVEVRTDDSSDRGNSKNIHLIAKTLITNPLWNDIFQPNLSFLKEANFYSNIIPSIEQFQEAANVPECEKIDAFIHCFGFRLSLNPSVKVADDDAILLLENIKLLDYSNIDRRLGFSTDETLAILKQLAKFHALCIVMRYRQPELFTSRISPFLQTVNWIVDNDDPRILNSICNDLQFVDDLDANLRCKIQKQLKVCYNCVKDRRQVLDTSFTTVVHRDLWCNNIMIKKDDTATDKCIHIKIYDFQLYSYQSLALDLALFLFSSVRSIDLATNFHVFIHFYHKEFLKMLDFVNFPSDNYTFEKMWHEIQEKAKLELLHILFMVKINNVDESTVTSVQEATPDTLFNDDSPSEAVLKQWKFLIDLFVGHGFI